MDENIVYYGVYYATDGSIILLPGKTQEECLDKLKESFKKTSTGEYYDFCKATTVIKRDLSNCTNPEYIFGCPKSLNLKFDGKKAKKNEKV